MRITHTTGQRIISAILAFVIVSISVFAPVGPNATQAVYAQTSGVQYKAPDALNCGIFGDATLTACFPLLGFYLFTVPGMAAMYLASQVFDKMIGLSLDNATVNAPFIEGVWKALRDLTNLFFIFILLYIAISMIFGFGNYKRMLASLVIVALIINFSSFFTKIVIDASNVLATGFYSAVNTSSTGGSISQAFVANMDTNKIFGDESFKSIAKEGSVGAYLVTFLILGIIYFVIAYALFVGGFLMLGRLISLWFLIIASPLAIAFYAVPNMRRVFSSWFGHLINQSFLAPVFLFFVYVTMVIANNVFSSPTFTMPASPDFLDILLNMLLKTVVVVSILLFGLKVSRSVSGSAGSLAMKFAGGAAVLSGVGIAAKYARKKALSGVRATGRAVKQQTVDRAAYNISESERLREFGKRMPALGMALDSTLNKLGASKYAQRLKTREQKLASYGRKITAETKREQMERELGISRKEATLRAQGVDEKKISEIIAAERARKEREVKEKVAKRKEDFAQALGNPPIDQMDIARKEREVIKNIKEEAGKDEAVKRAKEQLERAQRERRGAKSIEDLMNIKRREQEAHNTIREKEYELADTLFKKEINEIKQLKKKASKQRFARAIQKITGTSVADWRAAKQVRGGEDGEGKTEADRVAEKVAEILKENKE